VEVGRCTGEDGLRAELGNLVVQDQRVLDKERVNFVDANCIEPGQRTVDGVACGDVHSDDTSDGLYGFVGGDVLSENLLEPALREAEKILPRPEITARLVGVAAASNCPFVNSKGVPSLSPALERSAYAGCNV